MYKSKNSTKKKKLNRKDKWLKNPMRDMKLSYECSTSHTDQLSREELVATAYLISFI